MVKSSSSFISRVTPHDVPTKRMAEHDPAGIYAFLNINRAFMWLDLSAEDRVGTPATSNMTGLTIEHPKVEPISKILFTKAFALCHDVNKVTLSSTNCDMVMGFNASDFLWWDPPTQKYSRLNKNGAITKSPPIEVKWIPGSENLFMAAHRDGTLIVYDKEKEDAPFVPEDDPSVQSPNRPRMLVRKSIQSKNQKTNPVAHYKIARDRIRGFAFSPAGQHVATVCDDGKLRIIDLAREELVDVQPSYYGALTCVTWSPDGLYLLTGGEDDTVSIWSVTERALVARCNGHKSWVSGVAFDPWRCDDQGNYRFASVGEDCRLLIWDFSPGMLARPRAASVRYNSISSVAVSRSQSSTTVQRLGAATPTQTRKGPSAEALETSPADDDDDDDDNIATNATTSGLAHPVVPRAECPKLPPVLSKIVDVHPLSWLEFTEDSLLVACKSGHVRRWERPAEADESTPMGMHKHNGSLSFANPFVK
ncbi:hypothetical protein FH972_022975 [Carpinus fangiana]|uniref:Uncharacterized protein n=1 Tax=Carpinus fangiana TaxID=176857 RepID=A0A5N6KU65_9ROSI|nr:hypothetical protein FH972_022975 [Carpinus fangiana]KAB8345922.1 hypothetical protein FH972_022975 [Carpinus fangiana]